MIDWKGQSSRTLLLFACFNFMNDILDCVKRSDSYVTLSLAGKFVT